MESAEKSLSTVQAVLDSIKIPFSSEEAIFTFLHCSRCVHEMPVGESPKTWARTQAGITPHGLMVWCTRHDMPVIHMTPEQLQSFIDQGPQCHGCSNHEHR